MLKKTRLLTRPTLARRDAPYPERGPSSSLYLPLEEWPRLPSTARIERAPFHRARSASEEGTWPLLPHPSEAARCASTGIVPATPPLFSILLVVRWFEVARWAVLPGDRRLFGLFDEATQIHFRCAEQLRFAALHDSGQQDIQRTIHP